MAKKKKIEIDLNNNVEIMEELRPPFNVLILATTEQNKIKPLLLSYDIKHDKLYWSNKDNTESYPFEYVTSWNYIRAHFMEDVYEPKN